MSDLKAVFDAAVAESKTLVNRPDNQTLLKLYSLFKQATEGDVSGRRPGFTDLIGRCRETDLHRPDQGTERLGEALVEIFVNFPFQASAERAQQESQMNLNGGLALGQHQPAMQAAAVKMQRTVLAPRKIQVVFLTQVSGHEFGGGPRLFRRQAVFPGNHYLAHGRSLTA